MKIPGFYLLAMMALTGLAALVHARSAHASGHTASKIVRMHGPLKPVRKHRTDLPHTAKLAALRSSAVLIVDPVTREVLFQKNSGAVMPIASLTKLMTALVVVEAEQDMAEVLTVTDADVDRLKYSSSRLRVGARLPRSGMLHIALMSSENRAASALGRNYPGGTAQFVMAMNAKARALGMRNTRYVEPTGLSSANVSTPEDLAKLVVAAQKQALIRRYSTDHDHTITQGRQATVYHNTNRLIANSNWEIGLQKTGYISEAGRCMVLHAIVKGRAVVMVFLDAQGKFSRAADANRVRAWLARGRRTAQQ
jgi:D-alanyl-D-alanine endopeptidase (penicillin-binding protein 7)